MSLYPQTGYVQASYGAPSFVQPSGYYQPPPPTAYYHVDAQTFRRDYTARLAELNVNSRPIIQNLSMVAQEFTRYSDIVVQCIEAHIRRVPPWMKLPAFYLLDAISKNVYEPYARLFAPFVSSLFLDTYAQVDPPTRSKMEEMLLTWRTGHNNKELFGVAPQISIERGVWGGGTTHADPSTGNYSTSTQVSKAQVLSELDFTLGQKERAIHANPYDATSQSHVGVLRQLRRMVEAGVSQDELRQILTQLRSFSQTAPQPPAPAAPPSIPGPSPPSQYAAPSYPQAFNTPAPFPNQTSQPTAQLDLASLLAKAQGATAGTSAAPTSAPAMPGIPDITNIYNALLRAGVVSTSATPTGAGETARGDEGASDPAEASKASAREYRKLILAQKIKLTSAGITKSRPDMAHLLYDRLPVQCKQCGIRFADNTAGKKDMQDHLDMHFRQNRKANQNVGRGHSRSWFVPVDDWIHDTSDVKGKGRADGQRPLNAKAAAAAEAAKRDAELRALYVVVPQGDEAKLISCPICKETIKSEFLEDDEEWVWKNAIKKDDRVFHATCHAEAVASTSTLAARLRNEIASGSRASTPEAQSARSTPPKNTLALRSSHSPSPQSKLVGVKRKVENDGSTLPSEGNGSPPTKKLAIES